jgi:hypothetical protein
MCDGWWNVAVAAVRPDQRREEQAKEGLGFGIETMGQCHAEKTKQEHGVTRARVDDLGRRVCNESPAVFRL